MSQRSITSFFGKAAAAASSSGSTTGSPKRPRRESASKAAAVSDADDEDSPVKRSSAKRARVQRAVLSSSEDEAEAVDAKIEVEVEREKENEPSNGEEKETEETKATPPSGTKKSLKKKSLSTDDVKKEDKTGKKSAEKGKKSPKARKSPKSSKPKESPGVKIKEEDPQDEKKTGSGGEKSPKKTEKKNAFAGFFIGKTGLEAQRERKEQGDKPTYDTVVKRSMYDPVEDAIWKLGEPVPYQAFARTLFAIETTSGRLKIVEILGNYFRSVMALTPEDLLPSVYLCLNKLAPAYEGIELGIGDMILIKSIVQSTGRPMTSIKNDLDKSGDLGIVAEESRGSQQIMFKPSALTLRAVFKKLREIADLKGHSSRDSKVSKIQSMLVACREGEAKFVIRSLQGKLRIGLAEQSVLQALAHACVMTPTGQETFPPKNAFKSAESDAFKAQLEKEALALKTAYCECPNYDLVIPTLLSEGTAELYKTCKLTPGIPLKPMLAHPTKGVQEVLTRFENMKFTCEWKYDGERAQIHLHEDGKITIYSRNQEDNTTKYPDIIERFKNCIKESGHKLKSCVLDTEAVAWDKEKEQILPFQVLSTRKRKDANAAEIKVQVAIFAFDLLYLNGEALVRKPFSERRGRLREYFAEVPGEFFFAKSADPETMEEVQEILELSVKENCEGLMVKTLDEEATYEIAKRSHNWLKLKKDYLDGIGDTLDLVVIGGYMGKGKRAGFFGGFLLACYDPENEEYQSICKIGTGFTDNDLTNHFQTLNTTQLDKPKQYYAYDSSLTPDVWLSPSQVWEVKAADLSVSPVHKAGLGIVDPDRGISLRFPRFIRVRDDKQPEDATTAAQVAEMYNGQEQVKNTKKSKPGRSADDDYDF